MHCLGARVLPPIALWMPVRPEGSKVVQDHQPQCLCCGPPMPAPRMSWSNSAETVGRFGFCLSSSRDRKTADYQSFLLHVRLQFFRNSEVRCWPHWRAKEFTEVFQSRGSLWQSLSDPSLQYLDTHSWNRSTPARYSPHAVRTAHPHRRRSSRDPRSRLTRGVARSAASFLRIRSCLPHPEQNAHRGCRTQQGRTPCFPPACPPHPQKWPCCVVACWSIDFILANGLR